MKKIALSLLVCASFYTNTAVCETPTTEQQLAEINNTIATQLATIKTELQTIKNNTAKPGPKKSPLVRFILEDDGAWRALLYSSLISVLSTKNYNTLLSTLAPVLDMIASNHTAEHIKLNTRRGKTIKFLLNRYVLLLNAIITTSLAPTDKARAGLISLIAQLSAALFVHHTNTEEVVTEEALLIQNA